MREIKVRYTVCRGNGYIFSETFPLGDIENGRVVSWLKNNYASDQTCAIHFDQFTGLRDRSGTEIYEGDILSDGTFVSLVRFSVDRYISVPKSWADGVTSLNMWLLKRSNAGCPVYVIGNSHEHAELLEAP